MDTDLRARRELAGFKSIKEFSEFTGIPASAVRDWEFTNRMPRYGKTLYWLVEENCKLIDMVKHLREQLRARR